MSYWRGDDRKRRRFEEEEDDDDDFDGGRGGGHRAKRLYGSQFFDLEAAVDSDEEEEEEEEGEDDFILDGGAELEDEGDSRRMQHRPVLLPRDNEEEEEDVEALERSIHARYYARSSHIVEYDDEETTGIVEQQALLPSIRDPKLWLVKCAIGHEREVAVRLMQKCIDKGSELQIRSAIALDHLQNYIYIEADKEAHVKEACRGMTNIYSNNVLLVPIKEMSDVLSVESKAVDISRDTWVRMKIGTYKGDLAKVVDVDNVRHKVTVKLIPRINLQALANKLEGREVPKKKTFVPLPRCMNVDEAREMHIHVGRKQDRVTGDWFEYICGMMFKDGFLYKTVSMKSISTQNIQPNFDELEKFRQPGGSGDGDTASLSTLFANRKKIHFMKGDRVIVVKGDVKNLKGLVEKVEEDIVHIRPMAEEEVEGLTKTKTLAVREKDLCKYFKPGNHVKVVSGATEGETGMVIKVDGHCVTIVSDTTKEDIRVFANNVVRSSEVTCGVTRIGDYELHDLVLLDNMGFGVIVNVGKEAFKVLKGVPERAEVVPIRLREIKCKLEKKTYAQDLSKNTISVKDVVRILEGPCKGKQGTVEHIYRGILFVYDHHNLEHAGFICAKSQSCMVVGGSRSNRNGNSLASRFEQLRTPPCIPESPRSFSRGGPPTAGGSHRGGRGHDALVGTTIKVRQGPFKGYRGRVVDVKGPSVRVELESQMKVISVDWNHISDNVIFSTPYSDTPGYGSGSETPMHPSRTPLHPSMTPMREPGATSTPVHDGMRTPRRDRAWNPYESISPPRFITV